MGFPNRLADAAKDPWLLLVAGVGGGLGWAVIGPVAAGAAIGAGMWGIGAAVGAALRAQDEPPSYDDPKFGAEPNLQIRRGTPQAEMVESLSAYIRDLGRFRESGQPQSVVDPAIAALVAAQGARQSALRVAAAIDGLDTALQRSAPNGRLHGVRAAVQRMAERRYALLGKLQHTVDGVAEVYTKLLEMSATVGALDVGDEAFDEVGSVNSSLDSLRGSLAELEDERRALP